MSILYGVHLSRRNILKDVEKTGAQTAQVFLGSPRSWKSPPQLSENELNFWESYQLPVYVHCSYLVNPASANPEVRKKSIDSLNAQFKAASEIKASGIVIHAGQASDSDLETAAKRWREVLEKVNTHGVQLLIENTSGGAVAPGRSLEGLETLWGSIKDFNPQLCFDTCHAWAGNMIAKDLPEEAAFEKLIKDLDGLGVEIGLTHLNGSKDPRGSGRDRHTNLTDSAFSFETSRKISRLINKPAILETPGPLSTVRSELIKLSSEN